VLRMIGDPETRYREDPVRVIRAIRFAAKLAFEIEPKTRAPLKRMAALLDNVPPSRTFDEMIKLLQTGHALASIVELKKQGLHRGVFPVLDVALDEAQRHDGREQFVQRALADTDARVAAGRPVAPSFMLAAMLWHDVQSRWQQIQSEGVPPHPALQQAVDAVFDARIGDISGRGKLAADMREIWLMQPRLERRQRNSTITLVEQPRLRAGLDFLRLRGESGEADPTLAAWWEEFAATDPEARRDMLAALRDRTPRRVPARRETAPTPEPASEDASAEAVVAAKKRRRRRRRPAREDGGSTDAAAPNPDVEPASGTS